MVLLARAATHRKVPSFTAWCALTARAVLCGIPSFHRYPFHGIILPEVREFIRDTKPRTNTTGWARGAPSEDYTAPPSARNANALSAEEVSRHNVQLINVPFSDSLRRRANCTHRKCILMLEDAQRRYVHRPDDVQTLKH